MAQSLERLVDIASFSILQDKLERWLDDYHVNTCDQNVSRCCEVIELNAKIQGQLFKLLSLTAGDGGAYGGASVIRTRLLPWLGQGVFGSNGVTSDTSLRMMGELADKDRELSDVVNKYETSMKSMDEDLGHTRVEADELKQELTETKNELETIKRQSTSDKMFTETEVRELRSKLRMAEDEVSNLRNRINRWEDVATLTARRDILLNGEPILAEYTPLPRASSPFPSSDITQRALQLNLITRYNDMFSHDRLTAMDILRADNKNTEDNQKIIFIAMQEAFSVAKLAFANYKMKVESNLALTHVGPETLQGAVQDYIIRNTDLYDPQTLVFDVIRRLNHNPRISLAPYITYKVINSLIREACKLAWNMAALPYALDIAPASMGELYDDNKYRRSYNSDFSAPLVSHHIWPCLVQGDRIIIKGECYTQRGASLNLFRSMSPTRSLSPSRARSPTRARSPSRARSRSPSPHRMSSVLSARSHSPARSLSPSRASSHASTSLSHYGVRS